MPQGVGQGRAVAQHSQACRWAAWAHPSVRCAFAETRNQAVTG